MIYESLSVFTSKIYYFTSFVNSAQGFAKPLTKEQEIDFFNKFKQGDINARDTLVNHNLRLVAHIVKKFHGAFEVDDMISVGTIGLMKAVDSFDYNKGVKFATYASRCIENEILMLIRSNKRHKDIMSLSTPVVQGNDKDEVLLEDVIAAEDDDDIMNSAEVSFMMDKVYEVIENNLNKTEQLVLTYRYGLHGKDCLPQREIAKMLGLSRSYISRIENKAMEILQKQMNSEKFNKK